MSFINYYCCPCGERWVDSWSCTCNDRCPACNKEIEPYHSDDFSQDERKVFTTDAVRRSRT